jgi:dTDP-4-amino-4,6-dideoxygalactose transaminase
MEPIPVLVPRVPTFKDFSKYLEVVDEARHYSNFGPLNELLLSRLSEYFSVPRGNLVSLANATLAIEGASSTLKFVGKGATSGVTWVAPSWTFSASIAGLLNSGTNVIFRDVADDYRVNVKKDDAFLLDVLPFGAGVDFSRYGNALNAIIVDGAASFDALENVGEKLMHLRPRVGIVLSLHATKNLPAGEGGIFISNDSSWVESVRRWSNFGMDEKRISHFVGTNAKLDEYSAAVCLAALDQWEAFKLKMRSLARQAQEVQRDLNLVSRQADAWRYVTPYWIVEFENVAAKRNAKSALHANNIGFKDWWESGCHEMPAYKSLENEGLSNTLRIANSSLGLPFHYFLSERDFTRIKEILVNL